MMIFRVVSEKAAKPTAAVEILSRTPARDPGNYI